MDRPYLGRNISGRYTQLPLSTRWNDIERLPRGRNIPRLRRTSATAKRIKLRWGSTRSSKATFPKSLAFNSRLLLCPLDEGVDLGDVVPSRIGRPANHTLKVLNIEVRHSAGEHGARHDKKVVRERGSNLLLILGRSDFIPIDSWALKLVSHEWYDGQPVTAKEVEKAFESWGEYKGLAFWFWDWKYKG